MNLARMREDLKREGLRIPSAIDRKDRFNMSGPMLTAQKLERGKAKLIHTSLDGYSRIKFKSGKELIVYSIDLE